MLLAAASSSLSEGPGHRLNFVVHGVWVHGSWDCVPWLMGWQVLAQGFLPQTKVRGPRSWVIGPRPRNPLPMEAVKAKINTYIFKRYGGSGDIEVSDVLDFCGYFHVNYHNSMDQLKEKFEQLEKRLRELTQWSPSPPQEFVLPPQPDDPPEFLVAPWQLGVTAAHSIKGKSKSIHILDTVHNFLARSYNSKKEPLELLFAPGANEGEVIGPWSMVHSIGMGKSSACRMILEAAFNLNLNDDEIRAIAPQLKALLRMRAIYDPAETEEQQFFKSMTGKAILSERPRPDPLMWATRWSKVIGSQGLSFQDVVQDKIKDYNRDKTEGVAISREEAMFITFFPFQNADFINLLEYHWQNYKVQESAVNIKRLALKDLNPNLKQKRCSKDNTLFQEVFRWTPQKNHYWLMREVGTFLKNIKEAVRAGKKVNLRGSANQYRAEPSLTAHDEACIFVHFLKDMVHHTTASQYQEIVSRYSKGHYNKELAEKAKLMDPTLKVLDFRFLQLMTRTGPGSKVQGPSEDEVEAKAEDAELNVVEVKLARERDSWQDYKRAFKAHHAKCHEDRKEVNAAFATKLNNKSEEFCNLTCPTRRVPEEGVQTFIADCISSWSEVEGLPAERVKVLFLIRFDQLGAHYYANAMACIRMVADHLALDNQSAALFLAPNTSKPGDCYQEDNIRKATEEMDEALRDDGLSLRVTRCSLLLNDDSLGGQRCRRPGCHTAWFVMSNTLDDNKQHVCLFDRSYLQQRRRASKELTVLERGQWVNPCAPLTRVSGGNSLSKAQRSKQWYTGVTFWTELRESIMMWSGLGYNDAIAWVDLLPYDDKLQLSVVNSRVQGPGSKVPRQMVIAPIWAKMAQLPSTDKVDNGRVEDFIKKSVRRYTNSLVRTGTLKLEGLDIRDLKEAGTQPPTYNEKSYKMTCPNAAGLLPLRQDWLDTMNERIQAKSSRLQDIIKEHNKLVNPSGVPYKGELKRPAEQSGEQDAECAAAVVGPEVDGPRSADDFSADQCIEGLSTEHKFFIKDGKLWLYAMQDQVVLTQEPLMQIWGEYMCGTENKKDIARFKSKSIEWNMTSMEYRASFSIVQDNQKARPFPVQPMQLGQFLYFLEEENFSGFGIECHSLAEGKDQGPGSKDQAPASKVQAEGKVQGPGSQESAPSASYSIEQVEECIFLPKALATKMKMKKENAGSCLDFTLWDFPSMSHASGRVEIIMHLEFKESENTILPQKPGIYLKAPIKVKKGDFILLA